MSPSTLLILTPIALATIAFVVWLSRAHELVVLRVRDGRSNIVRGRAPRALLDAFDDVVSTRPVVTNATLRVTLDGGRPRLDATGDVDATRLQRLRNVLGTFPKARLR